MSMYRKRTGANYSPWSGGLALLLVGVVTAGFGCGARTGSLDSSDGGAPDAGPIDCLIDADCPNANDLCNPVRCEFEVCVKNAPVSCTSTDPCVDAQCIPATGKCQLTPSSFDLDKDGYRGPKPGFKAGAPGSCGDDCDDTSADAFPGNKEVCDGVDNDCNGVVDDNSRYVPQLADVRVSSLAATRAYPGGLASDGKRYFAAYSGQLGARTRPFGLILDANGKPIGTESRLTQVESDAFPADALWIGDRYAVVWSDRRNGDYEVFMAMYDANGQKMAPGDIQVSDSVEFSISPVMAWTGAEFVVVWQDGQGENGTFQVFGRRIGLDGVPRSAILPLSDDSTQTPAIAVGNQGLALAWMRGDATRQNIFFRPFDFALTAQANAVEISGAPNGQSPRMVWTGSAFAVAWTRQGSPTAIWGATVDARGNVLTPARPLSDSPRFARDGALISLGDRVLLVHADNRDQNGGYELYSRMLTSSLEPYPNSASARVTKSFGDSVSPYAKFGPKGDVGILFRDDRTGPAQTYFTRLSCEAGGP
jgi:Putative metal-binding motif